MADVGIRDILMMTKLIATRSDIGAPAKLAMFLLLDFWNPKTGQLNPSLSTLGEAMGVGKAAAGKALQTLEAAGLIERVPAAGGRGRTEIYIVGITALISEARDKYDRRSVSKRKQTVSKGRQYGLRTDTNGLHSETDRLRMETPSEQAYRTNPGNKPTANKPSAQAPRAGFDDWLDNEPL